MLTVFYLKDKNEYNNGSQRYANTTFSLNNINYVYIVLVNMTEVT